MNNVGDPNSYDFMTNFGDNHIGNICKNNFESLMKYNLLKNTLPITNFIPNRIVAEILPEIFCLNLGKDYPEIVLYSIYSSIMKSENKQNYQISIINTGNYQTSNHNLLGQFDNLFNTFPQIKERSYFYYAED
ncbi:MAG: hypothetical protein V4591_11775 [Bdellovibrionota bacterium]